MNYYYLIPLIALIITLLAQFFVTSTYKKNAKIKNERKITGAEAARYVLDKNGLKNITIEKTHGFLTDHYDPRKKVIRLSESIYEDDSISSVAVACHECGHAIQDKEGYLFLKIRSKLAPITTIASKAGYYAILLGFILGFLDLIWIGIISEVVILIFEIITLPVEINASKRALKQLDYAHFLNSKELKKGKKVLAAAAFTYIASVLATIMQIIRLILVANNRNR